MLCQPVYQQAVGRVQLGALLAKCNQARLQAAVFRTVVEPGNLARERALSAAW